MEIGYIVGRFNHITIAHKRLIDIGLKLTDKLLVFVGSADKEGTDRNPFSAALRIELINKIYEKEVISGKLIVAPLKDMTNESDIPANGAWGRYVLENATKIIGQRPNISIYGWEESRKLWYIKEDLKDIEEIVYMRDDDSISATKIRKYLLENNKQLWQENTPCQIHSYYDKLINIIKSIHGGM